MAAFKMKSPRDCIILSYCFEYINIFLTPGPTCPIPVLTLCLRKYPGPESPALDYPWKGLFYLKSYKLKVSKVI